MQIETIRTISALRARIHAWRSDGLSIGMVPTMGALHAGHLALIKEAKRQADRVVVTLFVNPTQFAPNEDLASYPRDEEADRLKLADQKVDLLFAPSAEEMYPRGYDANIVLGGPAVVGLETDFRPHFFVAVATVVAKLFLAGLPDKAFFGEKDFQQLLVVQKLVRDLNIPTEIVACPTVREVDGLALSSRNIRLAAEDRQRAPKLNAMLRAVGRRIRNGGNPDEALVEARRALTTTGFQIDYFEARNAETLSNIIDWKTEPVRLLVAARLGAVRLIDNMAV